jgi:predicted ATPase/class 3 adenylate cyclase
MDIDASEAILDVSTGIVTILFTDIEGSTRLWEQSPEPMREALASHDALARTAVKSNRGSIVKMTGDGMYAVFGDPVDALNAILSLQQALAGPGATGGIALHLRCGLHAGVVERRDHDFFGASVNRAARIMGAAHGGQILVSHAIATLVRDRLPADVMLRGLGEVRLRDLGSAEHVYQVLHPRLRQDFPALRSLESTPNNLPQQVTSFVGRERELAEVIEALRRARLLTLLGVGGLGKTRLSLQVAAEVMDDYPDGVWFVELAPVTDERLVAQVVASVLGVKEDAGRPVIEALAKYVADRRALLILDNCEHLVQACAELVKPLLKASPQLRVMASSRELLHVAGEITYPVPSLAVPDVHQAVTPAGVTQYGAVRLFVDRAAAVNPLFQVTDPNAAAVAAICRRLDGIPLAIELAAARVRALSVETIAERLIDRFRLLTGGDRTTPSRQQTLRASIDWSHDLLSEVERILLRRLAVFAGGWTLDAAEAVGADDALPLDTVLDVLTHLVDKSLVALEADGERYAMLETVREYAQERLEQSGDGAATRTRHLGEYLAFAERARSELFGPLQGEWLLRLDKERENLLSAHAWCDRAEKGAEMGLRLVSAVKPYWLNRGLLGLGYRVTIEALARAVVQDRTPARCRGLFDAGQICYFMGRYDEAERFLNESLAIARESGDSRRIAVALQPLGMACMGRGDLPAARRHLEEGLALARERGDRRDIASMLNSMGQLYRMEGALDKAEPLYTQAISLAHDLGDREIVAVGLLNLAMVDAERGATDLARHRLLNVLAIAGEIGSKPAGQSVLEVSSGLASLGKEWARAARFFGSAEAQASNTGIHRDPADEAFLAPLVAQARSTLGAEAFDAAEAAGRALSYDEAVGEARAWNCAPDGGLRPNPAAPGG